MVNVVDLFKRRLDMILVQGDGQSFTLLKNDMLSDEDIISALARHMTEALVVPVPDSNRKLSKREYA